MEAQLSFLGGVDTVTGSCHLLRAGGLNILIDCGLFQGDPLWEERNYDPFPFNPSEIDYLLLTHGHLDHCGRIPRLVKEGFQGSIICTSATYDIAKIVLMDSGQIHEEDYAHWKKIWLRRGEKPREPLYTVMDALDSLRYFREFPPYGQPVKLNNTITVTFRDAGHILGASFLVVDIKGGKRIIFSGDLGNRGKPIIRDPELPEGADIIVTESTYGNRRHRDFDASVDELREVITESCRSGGNTLIPSFAIERAQDLLYVFSRLYEEGRMPECRVFLDTPMGIAVTRVMKRHPECFDQETSRLFEESGDPFTFPGLEFTRTPDESKQINFIKSHAIIIAGSGMCTGGRIKHHLKHNIWRPESSIVFVGYQAEGTLGRKIVDGRKKVKIFGETYRVKARVSTIGGFSSHADQDILLDWLGSNTGTRRIFIVHGEEGAEALKKETLSRGLAEKVTIPHYGDSYDL
jgi:metallo-beta-lactamase family protein